MPTYAFQCPKGHEYEYVFKIAERDTPTQCPKCKEPGERIIAASNREPSFTEKLYGAGGYFDPNLDRHITSPEHRKQVMAELGVMEKQKDKRTTYAQEKYLMNHRWYRPH